MNVGEILERVRLEIDHDQTDAQVIGRLNQTDKRLFRKFPFPEKIYGFETTAYPYYELPDDCPEDRIRCVVIEGVEYIKLTPEIQYPPPYFCTVLLGALYININPVGKIGYLYYRNRPGVMTPTNLTYVPGMPEDYHELYVYDAAQWIAGIQRDIDMKNNFMTEYDTVYKDAVRDLKKMGLRRVKETTRW